MVDGCMDLVYGCVSWQCRLVPSLSLSLSLSLVRMTTTTCCRHEHKPRHVRAGCVRNLLST